MKRHSSVLLMMAALAGLLSGCAGKVDKSYQVSAQPPANYITSQRSAADIVNYAETDCAVPAPFEGSAIDYLKVITDQGSRRSGTRAFRCAEVFVRNTLQSFGYQTEEIAYPFPYYDFDLAAIHVVRARDGKEFPAFPMQYSATIGGTRTGKLVRPRRDLTGCFVYASSGMLSGDIKKKYALWQKRGALGMIVEANLRPEAARGLPHPRSAHATSWHYAVLPGFVVAQARELIGETITVTQHARIVQGTGYTVAAKSATASDRYVVVTGHLDSWFQGALDDGSGVAALLEIAKLMKSDPQGVIFLAVDSEELGLIGSAAYLQRQGLEKVAAVVELDMVSSLNNYGRKPPSAAGIMPRVFTVSTDLKPRVKPFFQDLGGRKLFVSVEFARSITGMLGTDYEWFYGAGVPGIFIYAPSRYYHTARDTIEWIPPADLQAISEDSARLVRYFRENAATLPQPEHVIPLAFTAEQKGNSVEFTVRLDSASGASRPGLQPPKVLVRCYFEQGYERNVDLKRGEDGVWRGAYRLPWPGEWDFLAIVSRGESFGKRWAMVNASEVTRP